MVVIEDPRYGETHTLHDGCYPYAEGKLTDHEADREADDGRSACLWCGETITRQQVAP
jgi:hypothetical protein